MSNPENQPPTVRIIWSLGARLYALLLGGPLSLVAIGLIPWMFRTRFFDLLDPYTDTGVYLLLAAFSMTHVFAGLFLFSGFQRVSRQQPDALALSATGHLLLVAPAVTLLVITFLYSDETFWIRLTRPFNTGYVNIEWLLTGWLIFHIYIALLLALADNSWLAVEEAHKDQPDTNKKG